METRILAEEYFWKIARALTSELKNTKLVYDNVAKWKSHAPGFEEVRFCKGCVLPIVDRVTTLFFKERLNLSREEARSALRCEGASTLSTIYTPGPEQSGFSGITWGTNYQPSDKSGRQGNYRPCPDFGIIQSSPSFNILGEVKYAPKAPARNALLASIKKDMNYYMRLPRNPELGWPYEFGVGVAFGAASGTDPVVEVITDDWAEKNYFIILFHNTAQ